MMKKILLTSVNFIVILPFVIFFNYGAYVIMYMLPVIFVLSLINAILSQGVKEFLIKNLFLGISGISGIVIDALLYFIFICYDTIGVSIMLIEVLGTFIYIAILSAIGIIIKRLLRKLKNK